MKGFIHTHTVVREQIVDPRDGQEATLTKAVPRPIADLKDKAWEDPEYLLKTLVPSVSAVRELSPSGNLVRTLFLKGSSGPKDRNGRPYGQLRIGQLIQGRTDPDPETGESKLWTMLVLEGSQREKPAPAQKQGLDSSPKGSVASQEAPGATPEASKVSEEVAAL